MGGRSRPWWVRRNPHWAKRSADQAKGGRGGKAPGSAFQGGPQGSARPGGRAGRSRKALLEVFEEYRRKYTPADLRAWARPNPSKCRNFAKEAKEDDKLQREGDRRPGQLDAALDATARKDAANANKEMPAHHDSAKADADAYKKTPEYKHTVAREAAEKARHNAARRPPGRADPAHDPRSTPQMAADAAKLAQQFARAAQLQHKPLDATLAVQGAINEVVDARIRLNARTRKLEANARQAAMQHRAVSENRDEAP